MDFYSFNNSTRKSLGGYLVLSGALPPPVRDKPAPGLAGLIEGDGSIIVPKTIRSLRTLRYKKVNGSFKFLPFILVHSKNEIYRDRAKDEDNKSMPRLSDDDQVLRKKYNFWI